MQSKVKYFLSLALFSSSIIMMIKQLEKMKLKQKILAEQSVGWGIMFWH